VFEPCASGAHRGPISDIGCLRQIIVCIACGARLDVPAVKLSFGLAADKIEMKIDASAFKSRAPAAGGETAAATGVQKVFPPPR
jgi:hypothetical protein